MFEVNDELRQKKIIDFTDEELVQAGFVGVGVPESVSTTIRHVKEYPHQMGHITGLMVDCQKHVASKISSALPPPFSIVSVPSDNALTAVKPNLVCEFEKRNYYVGLCSNDAEVPLLYYRTNLNQVPFPMPSPGMKRFKVAHKTAHGPFDKVLTNKLWATIVGPMIITHVLDARGIKYQSLESVRFSTRGQAGKTTRGPLVIWIGTHYGTTSAETARDASPAILRILTDQGVNGAEVEWFERKDLFACRN